MPSCSAANCKNRWSKGNFHFYRFPSDPTRRQIWTENTKREKWTPKTSSMLCEVHFESSEFEQNRQDGKRRLKPNAIPTLFPNRPPIRLQRRPFLSEFVSQPAIQQSLASIAREHDHQYTPKKPTEASISTSKVLTTECDKTNRVDPKPAAILVPITFHPFKPEDFLKSVHARHPTPILPYPKIQLDVNKPVINRVLTPYAVLRKKLEVERKKVRKLELERKNLTQNLKRFLNEDQVDSLARRSSRGSKWSLQTLQSGIELFLTCGTGGYKMLLDKGYPLPSRRTLRNRLELIQVDPENLRLIKDHFEGLQDEHDKDPEADNRSSTCNDNGPSLSDISTQPH